MESEQNKICIFETHSKIDRNRCRAEYCVCGLNEAVIKVKSVEKFQKRRFLPDFLASSQNDDKHTT